MTIEGQHASIARFLQNNKNIMAHFHDHWDKLVPEAKYGKKTRLNPVVTTFRSIPN